MNFEVSERKRLINQIRFGKHLFALFCACCLQLGAPPTAPVKAQRPMSPSTQDEGQRTGARRQGRLAPPPGLKCDLNHVTSFTGRVLAYSRHRGRIFIRVRTDEQTTNEFTISYAQGTDLSKWFMIDGQAIKPNDLAKIESRWRRNKRRARATVWACYDASWHQASAEIIDWRLSERSPTSTY
jgi:hypothetical protein